MAPNGKRKVVFVCVHNSARSQMAEALLRAMFGERYEVYSAGTSPTRVHPLTLKALSEIGIDVSGLRSKHVSELPSDVFDVVVTLCDEARCCSLLPKGRSYVHVSFEDPSSGDIEVFRRVRDEIRRWISATFSSSEDTSEVT